LAETQGQKPRLQIDPQQFAQEVAQEIAADLKRNGGQSSLSGQDESER